MYPYFSILAAAVTASMCVYCAYRILGGQNACPRHRGHENADSAPPFRGEKKPESATPAAEKFIEKYWAPLLLLIFGAFLFTRLFRLGTVPGGINQDELGMAYDARCLSQYGVDRYLHRLPVYLTNYGDGQSALYAYLTAFLLKFLPFSVRTIRLSAVLCAVPCFFAVYSIGRSLFSQKAAALFGCGLLTILPVFFMSERWGLDCYLLLSILTVSLAFYLKAAFSGKYRYYILAGIFFGVTLYTYAVAYLLVPLFLLLSGAYLIRTGKTGVKQAAALLIPLAVLGAPLLLFQLVNMGILPEFSTPFCDMYRLNSYRSGEISPANLSKNWAVIKDLLTYNEELYYNSLPEFGTVYTLSIPFVLYGLGVCIASLRRSVRKKVYDANVVILILFVCTLFTAMLIDRPNVNKANGFYLPLLFLIAVAVEHIYRLFKLSVPIAAALYCAAFLFFGNFYFRSYNIVYSDMIYFHSTQLGDVVGYLDKYYDVAGRRVYIFEKEEPFPDLQVALYGNVSPYDISEDKKTLGNYTMGLPEDIDLKEDAVYIIHNYLHHVSDWLGTSGFIRDDSFRDYAILYRPPGNDPIPALK